MSNNNYFGTIILDQFVFLYFKTFNIDYVREEYYL